MSAKLPTPSSQIARELRKKARKYNAKSYSAWLAENSLDTKIKASEDMSRASTALALSKRDEKEYDGLVNSGYARHLSDVSEARFNSQKNAIKGKAALDDAKSALGYAEYVSELEAKRNEVIDKAFKNIISLKIADKNRAYETALKYGLTETEAKDVAKNAAYVNRASIIKNAMTTIISKAFTDVQAKSYALSLGLSESDSDELATMARILNQMPHRPINYSGYYTEYFENLLKTKR